MRNIRLIKVVTFILFSVGVFLGQAQTVLQGTITNTSGGAESFANVSLPEQNLWTTTDENGKYIFEGVEPGNVLIQIEQIGYEALVENVDVVADKTTVADFEFNNGVHKLEDIVVTGTGNPKASIKTSISISTLKSNEVQQASPRSTAEIFRTIPGIRSESSGGEGNSNITVRGIPVSAGGSRYLLIQEDGLPVLQFGDIAFATQDQFVRYDTNIDRIEALRGGSASVLASNSPAGIINFISKTGKKQGGSIAQTIGLDYNSYKTDFEYGSPIAEDLYFHFGGFYRIGDGPRDTGYTSNNGGQFKFNITKKFEKGFVRLYAKFLNDRTAAYMPSPMKVTGTNSNPEWSDIANFDILTGTLQSAYLQTDRTMGTDGNILDSDVSDGMHSISKSIGVEFALDLGDGWKLKNNGRFSLNNGQFLSPFPSSVGSYASQIESIPGYNSAVYAGTSTTVDPNANYMQVVLFNTQLNNFNNYVNNLSISKKLGALKLDAGLYKAYQKVDMSWSWNTYLMEVDGTNARMIDVINASGESLSPNGLLYYGVPAWGNGLARRYNTGYNITAPYLQLEYKIADNLNLEGGLRYDRGDVNGYFSGGTGQTAQVDMNQNGTIDPNEENVAVTGDNITPVDYDYGYVSYSVGGNLKINSGNAVFARVSRGGSASADRILFSNYNYLDSNDPGLDAVKVNTVDQVEVGYKLRASNYFLNTTLFHAKTKESNYEATTQKRFDNTYKSYGVELDGLYKISEKFNLRGGLTYTHAEITKALNDGVVGNRPRRLPSFMYSLAPNYSADKFAAGAMLVGATKSYTQDSNQLVMDGYLIVNPYLSYTLDNGLGFTLNANNIFNSLAITEAEEGSITENTVNYVRARSLPGRTISLKLQYNF